MNTSKITRRAALAGAAVAPLAGCATFNKFWNNSAVQTGIQVAVDIGVGLVLANNPAEASAIQLAATALASVAAGSGSTTVAQFEAAADAKINSLASLDPVEKLALQQVVALAANALTTGADALPATAAVALNTVFTYIANAAGTYVKVGAKAAKMGLRK